MSTFFGERSLFISAYAQNQSDVDDKSEDALDELKYEGEGSKGSGDGGRLFWEQVSLMLITFSVTNRVAKCLKPDSKAIEFGTKGTGGDIKCYGYSTLLEVAGALTLLIGEIVQSVSVQMAIKGALGELTGSDLDENTAEKIVDDMIQGNFDSELILEEIKSNSKNCDVNDDSGAGVEGDICETQIRPLKIIRKIVQAQRDALAGKRTAYWVAVGVFAGNAVIELLGWLASIFDIAKMKAEAVALLTSLTAAKSNPVTAAPSAACDAAFSAFKAADTNFGRLIWEIEGSLRSDPTNNIPCASLRAQAVAAAQTLGATHNAYVAACTPFLASIGAQIALKANQAAVINGEYAIPECSPKIDSLGLNKGPPRFNHGHGSGGILRGGAPPVRYVPVYDESGSPERTFKSNKKIIQISDELINLFFKRTEARNLNKAQSFQVGRLVSSFVTGIGGIALARAFEKPIGDFVDDFIWSYRGRAVWSTLEGLLVLSNLGLSSSTLERLDENLALLDAYIGESSGVLSTSAALNIESRLVFEDEVARDFENQFLQNFDKAFENEKSPCPFGGDGKGGCASAKKMTNGLIGQLNLDGVVAETVSNVAKFGDELSNKNKLSNNAIGIGQKIIGAKKPLDKIKKQLIKKINEFEQKEGRPPIDIDKKAAQVLQSIRTQMEKVAAENNVKLASSGGIGSKKLKKKEVVKEAKKKIAAAAKKDSQGQTTGVTGFEFNFQQEKKSQDGIFTDDTIKEANVDKYSLSGADINKGAGKNIFKVISIRYFKSAYPILVEEAK